MKIALDLDGVLADTMRVWVTLWNKKGKKKIRFEDITSWDFWKGLNITSDEFNLIFNTVWKFWDKIPPTEEMIDEKVRRLNKLGHVDIVTGRTLDTAEEAKMWLNSYDIEFRNFIIVPPEKGKWELNYDVFIDDAPNVAMGAIKMEKYVLLYDRPWNRDVKPVGKIVRITSLSEAVDILLNWLKGNKLRL